MSAATPNQMGDCAARVRLASGAETPAKLLYFLARDPDVTVRVAVAMNLNAPIPADAVLSNDIDERVRIVLARKIALIAADLSDQAQTRLVKIVRSLLATLVRDEAERVRAMIADVLKELPNAPLDVIKRLARDEAASVSEPIIRLSPLLSEGDLVQLLSFSPGAVARRANISEAVSDAIVATADSAAIRALLINQSAAIREDTLDALVAHARDHASWHGPLVHRPQISKPSMRILSGIVTDQLLAQLAARGDLDPDFHAELRARIEDKIAQQATIVAEKAQVSESCLQRVMLLERSGQLNEAAFTEAMRSGDEPLVAVMLAVSAKVPLAIVERAVSLRSAKGLVSLTWRAGFSMRSAVAAQILLAKLPPRLVVNCVGQGAFPLTGDEMRWQLEFLEHAVRHAPPSWPDHGADAALGE